MSNADMMTLSMRGSKFDGAQGEIDEIEALVRENEQPIEYVPGIIGLTNSYINDVTGGQIKRLERARKWLRKAELLAHGVLQEL